jgi:DNA-binding transcriptional LysR family regulator
MARRNSSTRARYADETLILPVFVMQGIRNHDAPPPPTQLGDYEFVGPPERSMFGRTVTAMLQAIGVEPLNIVSEGTEFSVVRDLTVASAGLCCSLEASVSADVANKQVVVLDIDAPPLFADVLELTPLRNGAERPARMFSELLSAETKNWP